ncbi:MAG TPA: hydantoinase/oxoprolinase family protein [Gemmatimonadales bacterium]|jgi:probable H4MPT-linked C1 transfer pathway protein
MSRSPVIGWDLGGAHLKAARLDAGGCPERVLQLASPLWQGMEPLQDAVDQARLDLGPAPLHAITMTGEMVDYFAGRAEGVAQLVAMMRRQLPDATLRFFAGREGFVDADRAVAAAPLVASANWMASAALTAVRVEAALFVDIGSTTTDLVPVAGGRILAVGRDDAGRLAAGELEYTGVVRTPLMALAAEVPFAGERVPLMAEFFATTADVHRLTGELPETADQYPAADGGAKTVEGSARRLARMIGRDMESASLDSWRRLAAWLARAQAQRIEDACDRIWSRELLPSDAPVVVAGVGRFIAVELAARRGLRWVDFADLLPAGAAEPGQIGDCAPAVAVAWLAQQQ